MGPLAFSLAGLFPLFFGPFALSFAFAFRPGRTASQYCRQAGGPLLRQEPSQGGWLSLHHLDLQYSLPPSCAALLHPPSCLLCCFGVFFFRLRFSSDRHLPNLGHCHRQPEPFHSPGISHLGMVPAPGPSFLLLKVPVATKTLG